MAVKPENLIRHELIGVKVEVVDAHNRGMIGMKGIVVDETKGMVSVKTANGEKKIEKNGSVFRFSLPDGKVRVDGDLLVARPEERIKLKVKKW